MLNWSFSWMRNRFWSLRCRGRWNGWDSWSIGGFGIGSFWFGWV